MSPRWRAWARREKRREKRGVSGGEWETNTKTKKKGGKRQENAEPQRNTYNDLATPDRGMQSSNQMKAQESKKSEKKEPSGIRNGKKKKK